MSNVANFTFKLKSSSGYECEGAYPSITPEQYEQVIRVLGGTQQTAEPVAWKHVRTGGLYRILAEGKMEADGSNVVVYQGIATGLVWVRPMAEFHDGRFERVAAPPAPQQAEPVAWQGIHDPTDLYYRKPPQADVRPLYASPQPRIATAQVGQIKRLADELVDAATDLAMAEASVLGDPSVRYKREELKDAKHAMYAALDALVKGE